MGAAVAEEYGFAFAALVEMVSGGDLVALMLEGCARLVSVDVEELVVFKLVPTMELSGCLGLPTDTVDVYCGGSASASKVVGRERRIIRVEAWPTLTSPLSSSETSETVG